jgi:transglutaminase-like putative cysteine protease
MLLKITHETDLSYSDLITESVMELRVMPRQEQGQHRLAFNLAIGPQTSVSSYFDWLGNTVHAFTVNEPHREIKIVASSIVETEQERIDPTTLTDTWPLNGQVDWRNHDDLAFGGPVVNSPLLARLTEQLAPREGEPLGELATRMLDLINTKFYYRKGITNSASPINEILEHGQGVCQDFTHLMIGLARSMRIPARYVSGFLHPDAEHFKGHTQTHAWCELLFPSSGWIGFDPANNCVTGANFVKVATGRDFRDVPPNKGVYRGSARETIDVRVTSEELEEVPPEIAAERIQSLPQPVTVQSQVHAPHREGMQQQDQQQQQQQQQQQ